jgi:hypothetical protein
MAFPLAGLLSAASGSKALGLMNLLGAGTSLAYLFGAGQPSEADQERMLRRQMEIQDEFEQQRAARMGGGMGGLVGAGAEPSLAQLMGEDELYQGVAKAAYNLDRARSQRPKYLDELEDILAGQHARVAALQAERTMSPLEVIQMLEGYGG